MQNLKGLFVSVLFIFFLSCKGQKGFGDRELSLQQTVLLAKVKGRIDHLDINLKDRIIYVAALGNNSLEAVDLKSGKSLYSIKDLQEPQGVAYLPQTHEVMVANGASGNCNFYKAASFEKSASVALGSDADDVRYDSVNNKVYVGYGNGCIALIDAVTHQKIADVKLPAHPEGFQLDNGLHKIFVNVPSAGEIDVIDSKTLSVVGKWKTKYGANFPMAIDEVHHIIFIGYRQPSRLVAMNAVNGRMIAETDLVDDTDDVFFDEQTGKIYASGGGGLVNIFYFDSTVFKKMASIPVRNGARTSLLIPSCHLFVLAERAGGNKGAQLDVFSIPQ